MEAVRWRIKGWSNHHLPLVLPESQFNPFNLNRLWTFIKQGSETANRDSEATREYDLLICCHSFFGYCPTKQGNWTKGSFKTFPYLAMWLDSARQAFRTIFWSSAVQIRNANTSSLVSHGKIFDSSKMLHCPPHLELMWKDFGLNYLKLCCQNKHNLHHQEKKVAHVNH